MSTHFNLNGKNEAEVLELLTNFQTAVENEKRYHDTLDNLLEGLQIIDFQYRYQYVNNTVVKQSKFSQDDLLGRTMMEIYPGIENTEMFKTLNLCMNARVPMHFENEFTYPDGSSGWFELSMQPVENGLVILSNDITERKKAEKEKLDYCRGLERALFMTSHNLRQPVTQIKGLIQLLQNYKGLSSDLDKIIDHLNAPSEALDDHTREITSQLHQMEKKVRT